MKSLQRKGTRHAASQMGRTTTESGLGGTPDLSYLKNLQQTVGNQAVIQLMKRKNKGEKTLGLNIEETMEEDETEEKGTDETAETGNADSENKKRKIDNVLGSHYDGYSSEVEESDDDEKTTLTDQDKMRILYKQGKRNIKRLRSMALPNRDSEGRFSINDPLNRKVYAADRSRKEPKYARLNQQDPFVIGQQALRLGEGRGHFIQAGGNETGRQGTKISEPPAEYENLIEGMLGMAKDPSANALYSNASDQKLADKGKFDDRELAAIMLNHLNTDVYKTHRTRSPLTEHLQKFVAITGVSELTRSFEAGDELEEETESKAEAMKVKSETEAEEAEMKTEEKEKEGAFSAETLIKMSLYQTMTGDIPSLRDVFYKGTGGEDSVFLGAPSEKHSSKKLGGAKVLRNPSKYPQNVKRQMSYTPDNKKEFKALMNAVTSKSKTKLPAMDEKKEAELRKDKLKVDTDKAQELLDTIKNIKLPRDWSGVNDFLRDPIGPVKSYTKKINQLKKRFAGNEDALKKLAEAQSQLNLKGKEASKLV